MDNALKPGFDHDHSTCTLHNWLKYTRPNHVPSLVYRVLLLTFIYERVDIVFTAVEEILFPARRVKSVERLRKGFLLDAVTGNGSV